MSKNLIKLISALGVVVVVIVGSVFLITRRSQSSYQSDTVVTGKITETVNENGSIKAAEDINLSFERSGKINRKYVAVGDKVKAGQILLALDNGDAATQLSAAQAVLNKQLAGPTPEYIAQLQAALDKANNDLMQTPGAPDGAEGSKLVSNAYDNLYVNLQSTQINLSSALTAADNILGVDNTLANDSFESYLSILDNSKINTAKDKYQIAKQSKQNFDSSFNTLNDASDHEAVNSATDLAKIATNDSKNLLFAVTEVLDNTPPTGNLNQVSLDAMKSGIAGTRGNIAARYAALISTNQAVDNARSNYNSLKTVAERAQAALNDAKNPPRAVDLASAQAAVAAAAVNYNKTILTAPFAGTISKQDGEVGALATPGVPLVSIISDNKYQIEVYVSETDLPKISVANSAEVTLDNLDATVIKIDPAATISNTGNSAYKVTLQFINEDERLKVGLSANIKIIGRSQDNALIIPAHDLVQKNGQYLVMVLGANNTPTEQLVSVGLKSGDDQVEITSGLQAGDRIVSFANINN